MSYSHEQPIGTVTIPSQGEVFIYPSGKMYIKTIKGEWSLYGHTSNPQSTLEKYKERYKN